MYVMVLNTNLDAIAVIDTCISFIWTNRYYQYGDFELYVPASDAILENVKQDYYLQMYGSNRLMIVEKILIETDAEDGNTITISGRSLESILDRRVIWGQTTLSGSLQDCVEKLLNDCIIAPSNVNRKISNFIFKKSSDPTILAMKLEAQYTGDNLYDVIQKLCEERGIGFRITLNDTNQFVFEMYVGVDRSYDQTSVPYVVFSPRFDNVISSNYMESKSPLKNVALVGGEGEGSARRYTAVGNLSGLDRRELFVDARDISSDIDEDITKSFNFTKYPSQVFDEKTKTFVSNTLFNSCMVDVSKYAGRTILLTIPKYTNPVYEVSGYATILVTSAKRYVSTLKSWEKYGDTANRGILEEYELLLPKDAAYIYTSMFSSTAISGSIYSGSADDFSCSTVKLSDTEYIAQLRQRGQENLAENIAVTSFEGEMETSVMYKYGTDFFDGDVVQIENEYGHNTKVRVLEVVTSEDEGGISVYPTFKTLDEEGDEAQ